MVSTVEVLDPMVLSSKVKETDPCSCEAVSAQIPECIRDLYEDPLVLSGGNRQLLVTLGQFSIIRLERAGRRQLGKRLSTLLNSQSSSVKL